MLKMLRAQLWEFSRANWKEFLGRFMLSLWYIIFDTGSSTTWVSTAWTLADSCSRCCFGTPFLPLLVE